MKPCRHCNCHIPDQAAHCPHCRERQKIGGSFPAVLVAVSALTGAGIALDACPAAFGATPPSVTGTEHGVRQTSPQVTIARLRYEGGGDWYANPSSLPNLLHEIRERTGIDVADRPAEVALTDPDLPDYPYLYMTGHGNVRFSELELSRLRAYLRTGGFLHADDNYGLDESFRREMQRVFPDIALTEVPLNHPVFRILYPFPEGLPKIHEHDGKPAQALGIFLDGRLAVFYSYESDLGDGWEDVGVHDDPIETRERALEMGVNLFLYALASSG